MKTSPHEHHVSGAVGGIGSTQYTDKKWTVGIDVSLVEPPVVCRDGDSIQVCFQCFIEININNLCICCQLSTRLLKGQSYKQGIMGVWAMYPVWDNLLGNGHI